MTLTAAINSSLSGLRTTQEGIDLVSRNVANAGTPGYTRKVLPQENAVSGGEGIGVRRLAAARQVDLFLQRQLRTETGLTSKLDVRADFLSRIDQMFGRPEDESSIAGSLSKLASGLQGLTTDPESTAARQTVLNDARRMADQLNSMTRQLQTMRLEAEQSIGAAVDEANGLLQTVADINSQITQRQGALVSTADLEDQRDNAINALAKLMDIRVIQQDNGAVNLFTGGGNLLLGTQPVTLTFDERTAIDASSQYNTNPALRTVGTIGLVSGGVTVDLIAAGAFTSGKIGGYIELRDKTLTQAQSQLDELAAGLALALSQETVASTAAPAGPPDGFDIDTINLLVGNQIHLNYTITPPGTPTSVTIIRVDDPSVLPLANTATADPNDTVIGINFNQPIANIVADLNAALPAAVVVSNPAGNVLRFVDDGVAATSDINSLSATITPAGLVDSGTGLPLFVDGLAQTIYSGSLDGQGQKLGFAGRIQLNAQVVADDTRLVVYQTSPATPLGDPSRPLDLLARLKETNRDFNPSSGIGGVGTPFSGSVDSFARRIVSFQASQSSNANRDLEAQEIVSLSLQDRFDSETGVSIDGEMANLLLLQNAYAANARVIGTVRDLFNVLLSIGR